jgi:cytidine deaminase
MTPEQRTQLIQAAIQVRRNAYIPYSGYAVGAALLTTNGEIVTGCNLENAAFSPTICAERAAVAKAVSEGWREFVAIAVVTENAGSPCGVCRQTLNEFSPQMLVIIADVEGKVHAEILLSDLLPLGFGPSHLP